MAELIPNQIAPRRAVTATVLDESLRVGTKHTAVEMVRESTAASAGVAGFSMSPALLGAVGLTAAVSAGLTELEFQSEKRAMRRLYSEELAAKLGKPVNKVSDKDLERFAKGDAATGVAGNKTMADAIGKARKQRNFGIVISVMASIAALAVVGLAAPPILGAIGLGASGALAVAHPAIFTVAKIAAEGIMGLMAYNSVKSPLHWVADKFFGMDDKTTHDRIVDIIRDRQAGKPITQHQVMGVFVSAHPELDQMVESRYGQKFESLPLAVQVAVTNDLSGPLHLAQLTNDINHGKVNATELAFAVEGQASGVKHSGNFEHAKPGKLRTMLTGVGSAMGRVANIATGHLKEEYPATTQGIVGDVSAAKRSFVDKLGLSKGDSAAGYAERIDSARGDTVLER